MIHLIETESEFGKMCIKRGFMRRAARFYVRCIGDGIYQTIYTGFKKYVHPESPSYSPEKRKSYYISIGLHSLYSHQEEDVFASTKDAGGYTPADLNQKSKYSGIFHGIEADYDYMENNGFDVLDSITTQEQLLKWWDMIQVIDTGCRIHDLQLVEPLLLCGKLDDAQNEISTSFIHGIDAYISYLDHMENGRIAKDYSYEQRLGLAARQKLQLWRWCIGRNTVELNNYIQTNYEQNIAWVQKYGIPTILLAPPRTLVNT